MLFAQFGGKLKSLAAPVVTAVSLWLPPRPPGASR
jgi:hypothetical protein